MRVQHRPGAVPPASAEAVLHARGGTVRRWSAGPGEVFAHHEHQARKLLIVLEGSIAFTIGAELVEMTSGDLLDLPARTPHRAIVGRQGVTCVETFVVEETPN